mmetsp:Transcript_134495/g.335529  ORF Transcript_134495/g.335529 Transcript_134495/m.335529 type:complete len:512 (+) Transcript_134495:108-1643(+)
MLKREDLIIHVAGLEQEFYDFLHSNLYKGREIMKESLDTIGTELDRLEGQVTGRFSCMHIVSMSLRLVEHIHSFESHVAQQLAEVCQISATSSHRDFAYLCGFVSELMSTNAWVGGRDVDAWILAPAIKCSKLVRESSATWAMERQAEFQFWVHELRFGLQSALRRLGGENHCSPAQLRLQQCCSPDGLLCVRNTFISPVPHDIHRTRRSRSVPASWPKVGQSGQVTSRRATALLGPPPAIESGGEELAMDKCLISNSVNSEDSCDNKAELVQQGLCAGAQQSSPPEGRTRATTAATGVSIAALAQEENTTSSDRSATAHRSSAVSATPRVVQAEATVKICKHAAPHRWWEELLDVCPISQFPVSLLPYPPLRFRSSCRGAGVYIDGFFLVLQVVANWKFEALGTRLSEDEIKQLDRYMQRCKLGPFRIRRALDLYRQGEAAAQELGTLRLRAGDKLRRLTLIQSRRSGRLSTEEQISIFPTKAILNNKTRRRRRCHGQQGRQQGQSGCDS